MFHRPIAQVNKGRYAPLTYLGVQASALLLIAACSVSQPPAAMQAPLPTTTSAQQASRTPNPATLTLTVKPLTLPATPVIARPGPYPELYAEVDKALKSVVLEPLPPIRNLTNTGWIFRWKLDWTPPNLDGLPGAQAREPGGIPYLFFVTFRLHPVPEDRLHPGMSIPVSGSNQVEVLDRELWESSTYHWSLQVQYRSLQYNTSSPEWTAPQLFEVK